jgi:acetyl-CoA C-acetyltransferase
MSTDPTVIVAGARTPMGRMSGSLKGFSGSDLGGFAIKGALEKAGVAPEAVDYVIMGQVLTAGEGQIPARQAATKAGIPMTVPALSINKVCLSGIDAIALADQLIRAGEFDVVVAGGQESMTNAPHLLEKSRDGFKYGDVTMHDHMAKDGLWDAFTDQAMGLLTESANTADLAFSREEQDAFSARSHQLAARAWKDGLFDDEVVTVTIPQRKGDALDFRTDEGIRADTTTESLARLRPAFSKEGTITAGSASQISDGAAAVVVMRRSRAEELGLSWLAEIGAHGVVAGPDSTLQSQPARAIARACEREGIAPTDLDLVEINEAFAAVGLASTKELGLDDDKVNVNGGAIALGHPIGMSGARIVLHLALELQRRGGGVGAAALCGGGGQGDALVVKVPARSGTGPSPIGPRTVDVPSLVAQAREGRPRAVARLISLVEDGHPALREVMALLAPDAGRAHVVGVTGAPGVGKSTITNALVTAHRAAGHRVGVLAVDPSSPFSGGALLGDRIRMSGHAADPEVFIRSMASRGHLGGLSWAAPQALRVLDVAGCDVVLLETVGVGQSEVEVAGTADTTLVLLAPGMGDGIQAAKAGILEVADVLVVNKADREGADRTVRDLRHAAALGEGTEPSGWRVPVVRTVATEGTGVDDLLVAVEAHREALGADGLRARRVRRAAREVEGLALATLRARAGGLRGDSRLDALADDVVAGRTDPYAAADRLVDELTRG